VKGKIFFPTYNPEFIKEFDFLHYCKNFIFWLLKNIMQIQWIQKISWNFFSHTKIYVHNKKWIKSNKMCSSNIFTYRSCMKSIIVKGIHQTAANMKIVVLSDFFQFDIQYKLNFFLFHTQTSFEFDFILIYFSFIF
jgi:hypothetical protein